MNFRQLGKTVALILSAKKAEEIVILDVRKLTFFTDYFLFANGTSLTHLKTLHETLEENLTKKKIYPLHIDGGPSSSWQVLDFGGLIVHLFLPEIRKFYQLEKFWQGARKVTWKSRMHTNKKIRKYKSRIRANK